MVRDVKKASTKYHNPFSYRFMVGIALLPGAAVLTGCLKSFEMAEYDYLGSDRQAAIIVSEPLVYERAALINDRKQELDYLNDLLEASETQTFTPTLIRNLQVVRQINAALNLTNDPVSGINLGNQLAADDRRNEIELINLELQLAGLRNQLNSINNGVSSTLTISPQSSSLSVDAAVLNNLSAEVGNLKTTITTLSSKIDALSPTIISSINRATGAINSPSITALTSSPIETFRDREAYRSELRQAISSVMLDDSHDVNGNSLYRLQFHLTVLPGESENKWAMTQVEVSDLKLKEAEIDALYSQWLLSVNRELNLVTSSNGNIRTNFDLVNLGDQSGLYAILPFCVKTGSTQCKHGKAFYFAVPPDRVGNMQFILDDFMTNGTSCITCTFKNIDTDTLRWVIPNILNSTIYTNNPLYESLTEFYSVLNNQRVYSASPDIGFYFSTTAGSASPNTAGTITNTANMATATITYSSVPVPGASPQIALVATTTQTLTATLSGSATITTPDTFKNFIKARNSGNLASTYAVSPVELDQLISNTTNVSNAIDLALSFNQAISPSGLSGLLGTNYNGSAAARMEAIERVPRVISYATGPLESVNPGTTTVTTMLPGFGWVLGPKAIISNNGKTIEYRHNPEPQKVLAEVSIPAWWPKLRMKVKTAWIGNRWHQGEMFNCTNAIGVTSPPVTTPGRAAGISTSSGGEESNCGKEFFIEKDMRREKGDYIALTNHLLEHYGTVVAPNPVVTYVYPSTIGACAKETTFSIQGTNLWRDPQVFINGKPGGNITVLPGMAGINVTFNIEQLFTEGRILPIGSQYKNNLEIDIYTRDGYDYYTVDFLPTAGNGTCRSYFQSADESDNYSLNFSDNTVIVHNEELSVDSNGSFPQNFADAKLAFRPAGTNRAFAAVNSTTNTLSIGQSTITQKIQGIPAGDIANDGQRVQGRLLFTPTPGADEERVEIQGTAIYYHVSPTVKVTVITPLTPTLMVSLELPKNFEDAYSVSPEKLEFSAQLSHANGTSTVPLSVEKMSGLWPISGGSRNGQYQLSLVPTPSGQATYDAIPTGTVTTIKLEFTSGIINSNFVPPIQSVNFTKPD